MWENGTDCAGDDGSRNASIVNSVGDVAAESDQTGPVAVDYGDMAGKPLKQPRVGMSLTGDGRGYWMVASDGGVFAFGDAPFLGSLGGQTLSAPIAGMTSNGTGYTLVGQDGHLYPFS